jgi:hypothetical protein
MLTETYIFLANVVFALHGLFLLLIGPSLVLALAGYYHRHVLLGRLHNACVAIMAIGEAVLWKCPLVALEEAFRNAARDEMWYRGSYAVSIMKRLAGFEIPVQAVTALSIAIVVLTLFSLLPWRRMDGATTQLLCPLRLRPSSRRT